MIKIYYELTKPGIIYGNALNTIAGFFFASNGWPDLPLLVATLAGLSLVIACACVWNNYLDRDMDAKMERTKHRALVTGHVSGRAAFIFASILGLSGVAILFLYTNLLTLCIALFGVCMYVGLYTVAKRHTHFSTEIGSLAGAVPPLVGYTAVAHSIGLGGGLLFLIYVLWQMPHFFAISIYRRDEYVSANIPLLSITHGVQHTKLRILFYIAAFTVAVFALPYLGLAGPIYSVIMALACGAWLLFAVKGFLIHSKEGEEVNEKRWARYMFLLSLLVVVLLCVALILHK